MMHGHGLDRLRPPGGPAANLSKFDFQGARAIQPTPWLACRIFIDAIDVSSRNQPSLRGFNAGRLGSDVDLKRSKTGKPFGLLNSPALNPAICSYRQQRRVNNSIKLKSCSVIIPPSNSAKKWFNVFHRDQNLLARLQFNLQFYASAFLGHISQYCINPVNPVVRQLDFDEPFKPVIVRTFSNAIGRVRDVDGSRIDN